MHAAGRSLLLFSFFRQSFIKVHSGLDHELRRCSHLIEQELLPRDLSRSLIWAFYPVELLQLPDLTFRIDDALVEKKTMTLVYYPCGLAEGACVIPDGIVKIGDRAFMDCAGLTDITIPDSVVEIGNYAFSFYHGLTDVEIPSSVKKIGEFAFSDCSRLTSRTGKACLRCTTGFRKWNTDGSLKSQICWILR